MAIQQPEESNNRAGQRDGSTPSYYVGIGASAGGLEAIETFFKNMPLRSGLAFIVVQHLSPDYKSLMGELLAKHTEIPIYRAEDGMKVKTDSIYLIPPKRNLTIFHGKLLLGDQDHSRGINLPIDVFLRSLSNDQGEKAIAVILSGTGSDGTRGVRAIKESGGMVMVQKEESAKFDGMPRSAIATGLADFILHAEEMSQKLMAFIKHPYATRPDNSERLLDDEDGLIRIFSLLRDKHKIDFTYYKPNTVVRRIERRMTVNQIDGLRDYVQFMESHPHEVTHLHRELLIGVTSFFRDPEAFGILASKWIPKLLKESKEDQIRFWVPGCSTGEEAYSLAILCQETLAELDRTPDIKIFATDVDDEAIQQAGTGNFPESIAAELSQELLAKYFFRQGDHSFHIARSTREMVVFAAQNIIKDPPFTNISLISCRNLLIYLQPVLQRKVLELANFSLVPGGVLFLGASETVGEMSDYFETVDPRWRIYRSKGRQTKPTPESATIMTFETETSRRIAPLGRLRHLEQQEGERILERAIQSIAELYFTCAFVVNETGTLLHIIGNADDYLKIRSGKLLNDISKLIVSELSIPLLTGIQRALKNQEDVLYSNIRLNRGDEPISVQMQLHPLPEKRNRESLVLILIEESQDENKGNGSAGGITYDIGMEAEQRIGDLENELQFTRENLQATIEELETSNEELQATNEELLASNEELQSTNEELQSVNEELYTVNAEHQKKILELTEANNDVKNLLSSDDEVKLFLDEKLNVRIFTPPAVNIFKILHSDLGRPIGHIAHNLLDVDLMADLQSVKNTSQTVRKEVNTSEGRWYLMRIMPYYIAPKVVSGTVLALTDISELKHAQEQIKGRLENLQIREEKHRVLFETMTLGAVYQDEDGRIIDANPSAQEILGLSLDQMRGKSSTDSMWKSIHEDGSEFAGDDHPAMVALKTGKKVNNAVMGVYHPQRKEYRWLNINAVPKFRQGETKPYEVFATFDDITERKQGEKQYQLLFDTMTNGFAYHEVIADEEGMPVDYMFLAVNSAFEKLTGLHKEQVLNKKVSEALPELTTSDFDWIGEFGAVALTGRPNVFTQFIPSMNQWFRVSAYCPQKGFFVTVFEHAEEPQ